MPRNADVVIAGAGIAGISTAWQIAERVGTATTVLVDPRPPLSVTSDRPAANYRDWWPQPDMVALAQRSIDLVEALLASGATFAMDRRGYLYVTGDAATAHELPALAAQRVGAGVAAEDVDVLPGRAAVAERFPHLGSNVIGAIHARRAGSLDTVGLGRALLAAAERRGIRVLRGEVTSVSVVGGRVTGVSVETADGESTIATERFVDAAGPFARDVARLIGADLPLETVLRQKVVMRDPLGVVPRDAPFTIGLDRTDDLPAGVHIKADDSAGSDAIKLGWARDQEPSEPVLDPACPPGFPTEVLTRAATILPALKTYLDRPPTLLAHDGGFYARTPDGLPLIGPLGVDGAFFVGGLAGFGSMMACGTGELAAAWVLGDPLPTHAASFDPRRSMPERHGGAPAGEL